MKISTRMFIAGFALALGACALPPSNSTQSSNAPSTAQVAQAPPKQEPLNRTEVEDIVAKSKSAAAVEKSLAGKPVSLVVLRVIGSEKNSFWSTQRHDPFTSYVCDAWSKSIEQGGWVDGTISRIGMTKDKSFQVFLTGCRAGSTPASEASVVPMKASEVEGLIKANALAARKNGYVQGGDGGTIKSTRQLQDKLVGLKVVKHSKQALPQQWMFDAIKARKDFSVSYSCYSYDKSFKVGATIYGNVEDVTAPMDDEGIDVTLNRCRTKR